MRNLKFNMKRRNEAYDMTIITNTIGFENEIDCLIDTGARVPVWCAGEHLLKTYYPMSIEQNATFILRGFGKGHETTKVYLIPEFILSDGKQSIRYKNMIVAVTNRDFTFNMILSYNMFNKMNISIDTFTNKNGTHSVAPNVKIASIKDTYMVGYKKVDLHRYNISQLNSRLGTQNILDSIYIFNQQ